MILLVVPSKSLRATIALILTQIYHVFEWIGLQRAVCLTHYSV